MIHFALHCIEELTVRFLIQELKVLSVLALVEGQTLLRYLSVWLYVSEDMGLGEMDWDVGNEIIV